MLPNGKNDSLIELFGKAEKQLLKNITSPPIVYSNINS